MSIKCHFCFLTLLLAILRAQAEDDVEVTTETERFCRQRNKTVGDERNEMYNAVEAFLSEQVMLQCHFCEEIDDGHPKNWFRLDRMDDAKLNEVKLDMENNMTLNRMHVNVEHTLIIHDLNEDDAGEYFCKGLDDQDSDYKYNFLLDVIVPAVVSPESGNLTDWKNYHDEQYGPINKLLLSASGADFEFLRTQMKVDVEMVTEWDSPGACDICGRPKGEGRMETKGHCKLKITRKENSTVKPRNYHENFLLRSSHLSCRSLILKKLTPDLFNRTVEIPAFINVEKCDGLCNPDAEGIYKGWKSTKKGYKFRKTFVLAENAHLTIICPESTLENQVVWKINGHTIKPGESVVPSNPSIEPRVTVDTFNTLYLYDVTKDEEGNYTCQVDGTRMQQVRVFVVSKSKLLTQAFVRHMMYLAFVLSLTLSCYCAGLVITWTRRHKFKTYTELVEELKKARKLYEDDVEEQVPLVQAEEGLNLDQDHEQEIDTESKRKDSYVQVDELSERGRSSGLSQLAVFKKPRTPQMKKKTKARKSLEDKEREMSEMSQKEENKRKKKTRQSLVKSYNVD